MSKFILMLKDFFKAKFGQILIPFPPLAYLSDKALFKIFSQISIQNLPFSTIQSEFKQSCLILIFSNFQLLQKDLKFKAKKNLFSRTLLFCFLIFYHLKILTSKISKPAISSTPIKCCLFCLVSSVSLHFLTSHLNNLSNMAFDMAPTEYDTLTQNNYQQISIFWKHFLKHFIKTLIIT